MTTPARLAEADRAAIVFQFALADLGVGTIQEALALWQAVPPTQVDRVRTVWLRRAVRLVMTRRARARDLAMAYYRLTRALRTGSTIADPRKPDEPSHVTLSQLREEFEDLIVPVSERSPEPSGEQTPALVPEDNPEPPDADTGPEDTDSGDADADRILVEEIEALEREEARLEREAEREAQIMLDALGPANLNKKLGDVDDTAPGAEVDVARAEAHRRAGTRQAATAERIAMNAARSTIWTASEGDSRVIGYIRLSRTGTPCGWCAMLISRGPVYKSEKSASVTYDDGDMYHDNCHCYAEPVYSTDQYAQSDLFALNREYQQLWPQVTQGLSGKSALSAWRRFIRQSQAAQEAAPTTSRRRAQ